MWASGRGGFQKAVDFMPTSTQVRCLFKGKAWESLGNILRKIMRKFGEYSKEKYEKVCGIFCLHLCYLIFSEWRSFKSISGRTNHWKRPASAPLEFSRRRPFKSCFPTKIFCASGIPPGIATPTSRICFGYVITLLRDYSHSYELRREFSSLHVVPETLRYGNADQCRHISPLDNFNCG